MRWIIFINMFIVFFIGLKNLIDISLIIPKEKREKLALGIILISLSLILWAVFCFWDKFTK